MRQRNKQNNQSNKLSFLQKFAGKLNILTKDGQIREQNSFKLPIINSPQSKRAQTMKLSSTKQSSHSFFSVARSEVSLSTIENRRSDNFFRGKIDRHLKEISNNFSKQPSTHDGMKKSGKKIFEKEPLTAIPFSNKKRAEMVDQHWRQPQSMEIQKINNNNIRNYDYEKFLSELNSVSSCTKIKKGQSQMEVKEVKKCWQ